MWKKIRNFNIPTICRGNWMSFGSESNATLAQLILQNATGELDKFCRVGSKILVPSNYCVKQGELFKWDDSDRSTLDAASPLSLFMDILSIRKTYLRVNTLMEALEIPVDPKFIHTPRAWFRQTIPELGRKYNLNIRIEVIEYREGKSHDIIHVDYGREYKTFSESIETFNDLQVFKAIEHICKNIVLKKIARNLATIPVNDSNIITKGDIIFSVKHFQALAEGASLLSYTSNIEVRKLDSRTVEVNDKRVDFTFLITVK